MVCEASQLPPNNQFSTTSIGTLPLFSLYIDYVDDLPIVGTSKDLVMEFIAELRQQFPIEHIGPLEHFLGIHVKRNRTLGISSLSQQNFVDNVWTKFDMFECSPISTPLTVPCKLLSHDSPQTRIRLDLSLAMYFYL